MSKETFNTNTSSVVATKKMSLPKYCWHMFELTRLHKFPLGNILVIWPCLWALTMASSHQDNAKMSRDLITQGVWFILGSTLLHSAACVLNDICDIDFDRQVERTKNRPLVTGSLSLVSAWTLLGVFVVACFYILSFANQPAAFIGVFGIFPLHAFYPLMKRWTWWPQAWLGIAMNWGFPVAWLYVRPRSGHTDVNVMCVMMLGMLCWTIVYDTQYGCQDKKDDATVGVKSTSLLFGDNVRPILMAFAAVFIGCLTYAGVLNNQTTAYFVVSCGGAAIHLAWQFYTWEVENPADCGAKFKSHGDLGAIVWAGIVFDYVMGHT